MGLTALIRSIIEKVKSIINSKREIREAIIGKEVEVPEEATLAEMPDYIDQIPLGGIDTSDATATAEHIIYPYTAYVNKEKIEGEIVDRGRVNKTLNKDETSFTVEKGFYSGGEVKIVVEEQNVQMSSGEQVIEPSEGKLLSKVTVEGAPLEELTVKPSEEEQIKLPSDGNYGFSKVTAEPMILQEKTVSPAEKEQIVSPDDNCHGLKSVIVNALNLQSKIVSASPDVQNVEADEGFDGLKMVTVKSVDMTYDSSTKTLTIVG